ncbi:MAG: hypothetical protein P8Y93_13625, partial [Acidobacteriota bacterium]
MRCWMLMDGSQMSQRFPRQLSYMAIAALLVLLVGCASSSPSTTQAPPETPEKGMAATEAPGGQDEGGNEESGKGSQGASGATAGKEADGGSAAQPSEGSAATADEAVAALDSQLEDELSTFDRQMSEEMRRLAEESQAAEQAASSSVAGGSTGGATAGSASEAGGRAGGGKETGGDAGGAVGGSGAGTTQSERVPPDVGDGSDDDIVARQLREAAIEEDDPELRAKLW